MPDKNSVGQMWGKMKKKNLKSLIYNDLRFLEVRAKGLEPIRTKAPDPKSGLATNYNTPAP